MGVAEHATFKIDAAPGMRGTRVYVNGDDVTDHVTGYRLVQPQGEPPMLTLELAAQGTIEGAGVVAVGVPGEAMAAWLESLDPKEVEKIALENIDMTGNVTAAILAHLGELARRNDAR